LQVIPAFFGVLVLLVGQQEWHPDYGKFYCKLDVGLLVVMI